MKRITIPAPAAYNIHWLQEQARARFGALDLNQVGDHLAIYFEDERDGGEEILTQLTQEWQGQESQREQMQRQRIESEDRIHRTDIAAIRSRTAAANSVPALRAEVERLIDLVEALIHR